MAAAPAGLPSAGEGLSVDDKIAALREEIARIQAQDAAEAAAAAAAVAVPAGAPEVPVPDADESLEVPVLAAAPTGAVELFPGGRLPELFLVLTEEVVEAEPSGAGAARLPEPELGRFMVPPEAPYAGLLVVKLERAYLVKDVALMGKMDPYATLTYGSQKQRSKVHRTGGQEPVWNQFITFNVVPDGGNVLRLELFHMGTFGDKRIAWCDLDVAAVLGGTPVHQRFQLSGPNGADREGHIFLQIAYRTQESV